MKKKIEQNIFEQGQLILYEDIVWGPVQMDDPCKPPTKAEGYVLRKKITKKQRKRIQSILDGNYLNLKNEVDINGE